MMMYYPGIVTCDSVTYNGSNLPTYFFKELPKKVMKGVADSGPVYQCLGLNEKVWVWDIDLAVFFSKEVGGLW